MSHKQNYYSAIVICGASDARPIGKKYRDIPKGKEQGFLNFVRKKFPEASYVNFYHAADKMFSHRAYL